MGAGAVFADKNQTDLANNIAAGLLLLAGKGVKLETFAAGAPGVQYKVSLDESTTGKIDGGGDGGNSSGVAVYELEEWDAASDPSEAVILVYDKTEDPKPKLNYFTVVGIYVRKRSISGITPDSLLFDPAGESKTVSIEVNDGDAWSADCIGSGFTVDKTSGAGPDTLTVTASANPLESERTGAVVVVSRSKSSTVALSQPDLVPPNSLVAQVGNGKLIKWTDSSFNEYKVGFTPAGIDEATCDPPSFTFKGRAYAIDNVGDQGGGVWLYMYLGA